MIYLHFIEPVAAVVPVDREALIGREGFNVVVRSGGSVYVIGPDLTVSRSHAKIYLHGGRYFIQDLGSLNGTRVNGEYVSGWKSRVPSAPVGLEAGSVVEVGVSTIFRVELVELENAEESRRRNHCSLLLVVRGDVADLTIDLQKVRDASELSGIGIKLRYTVSRIRSVFQNTLPENAWREYISMLEHHTNIIERNPHGYIANPNLLKTLVEATHKLKSLIDLEYRLCSEYCKECFPPP